MTTRILIAGLLGAIAMFVWTSLAHVALPLGQIGLSQMPDETAVLSAMRSSNGDKDGLYFFPWVDPKDPQAMEKGAAAMKANPSGLLIYHPPGHGVIDMPAPLIEEFVKELVQALIAAFLVSIVAVATFFGRVAVVTLIGISGTLMTNASYWIWYAFPLDYTLAAFAINIVGAFVAGLAIAWWLGRNPAA